MLRNVSREGAELVPMWARRRPEPWRSYGDSRTNTLSAATVTVCSGLGARSQGLAL